MKKEIILASGSPRRRELLNQIGIDFTVITSDADEITTEKSPEKIVMQLSSLKAEYSCGTKKCRSLFRC